MTAAEVFVNLQRTRQRRFRAGFNLSSFPMCRSPVKEKNKRHMFAISRRNDAHV